MKDSVFEWLRIKYSITMVSLHHTASLHILSQYTQFALALHSNHLLVLHATHRLGFVSHSRIHHSTTSPLYTCCSPRQLILERSFTNHGASTLALLDCSSCNRKLREGAPTSALKLECVANKFGMFQISNTPPEFRFIIPDLVLEYSKVPNFRGFTKYLLFGLPSINRRVENYLLLLACFSHVLLGLLQVLWLTCYRCRSKLAHLVDDAFLLLNF